jgi:hypothetical protein
MISMSLSGSERRAEETRLKSRQKPRYRSEKATEDDGRTSTRRASPETNAVSRLRRSMVRLAVCIASRNASTCSRHGLARADHFRGPPQSVVCRCAGKVGPMVTGAGSARRLTLPRSRGIGNFS